METGVNNQAPMCFFCHAAFCRQKTVGLLTLTGRTRHRYDTGYRPCEIFFAQVDRLIKTTAAAVLGETKMSRIQLKRALLSSAALLALPTFALAQTAPAKSDEIVVTAQKRKQDLTSVPISITALSGDRLSAERQCVRAQPFE